MCAWVCVWVNAKCIFCDEFNKAEIWPIVCITDFHLLQYFQSAKKNIIALETERLSGRGREKANKTVLDDKKENSHRNMMRTKERTVKQNRLKVEENNNCSSKDVTSIKTLRAPQLLLSIQVGLLTMKIKRTELSNSFLLFSIFFHSLIHTIQLVRFFDGFFFFIFDFFIIIICSCQVFFVVLFCLTLHVLHWPVHFLFLSLSPIFSRVLLLFSFYVSLSLSFSSFLVLFFKPLFECVRFFECRKKISVIQFNYIWDVFHVFHSFTLSFFLSLSSFLVSRLFRFITYQHSQAHTHTRTHSVWL